MDVNVKLRITADGQVQVVKAAKDAQAAIAGIGDAAKHVGGAAQQGMGLAVNAVGTLRAESVNTASALATLVRTIGGLAALKGLASGFLAAADSVGQLRSRLKLATESTAEYDAVLRRINDVARNSYKSVADISEVFLQSATPMRELGFTTQQTLDLTEALSLSLVVSGVKAHASASKPASSVFKDLSGFKRHPYLQQNASIAGFQRHPASRTFGFDDIELRGASRTSIIQQLAYAAKRKWPMDRRRSASDLVCMTRCHLVPTEPSSRPLCQAASVAPSCAERPLTGSSDEYRKR